MATTRLPVLLITLFGFAGSVFAQATGTDPLTQRSPGEVDVSLGRQPVKEQVAAKLGIDPADVPLSVRLPVDIARQVCGMGELGATDATRSCTATVYAPALAEAASKTPR